MRWLRYRKAPPVPPSDDERPTPLDPLDALDFANLFAEEAETRTVNLIALLDAALLRTSKRTLIPASEVRDLLLDLRQEVTR